MDELRVEQFQLVNLSFLRLELAIYCRECVEHYHAAQGGPECAGCRLNGVKKYLDDPGQTAQERKAGD
jgi:hypothetical protein